MGLRRLSSTSGERINDLKTKLLEAKEYINEIVEKFGREKIQSQIIMTSIKDYVIGNISLEALTKSAALVQLKEIVMVYRNSEGYIEKVRCTLRSIYEADMDFFNHSTKMADLMHKLNSILQDLKIAISINTESHLEPNFATATGSENMVVTGSGSYASGSGNDTLENNASSCNHNENNDIFARFQTQYGALYECACIINVESGNYELISNILIR